jgi:YD repeat-containing protein
VPTGATFNNLKGRLVEAATDDCTYPFSQAHMITDEWSSYDDAGRKIDSWETTPHSSGFYHTTTTYFSNGQLNTLSGVPGRPTYTITLDSNGRPHSSTFGTTTITNNVNYNSAGQVTSFGYGTSGNNDAYTYDLYTGLMIGYTFTVGSSTDVGTLTWNPNGTLKTMQIVDGLNAADTQTCHFNPTDSAGTGYDDVGRLVGVNCGTVWSQTYTYDQSTTSASQEQPTGTQPTMQPTTTWVTELLTTATVR